ncbi:MAG TPA: hypothetical protein VFC23_10360 [Thermoanaerobaculia bacterium]|nr:hypothetical protein [Thermoanaerobaculia bacterium]
MGIAERAWIVLGTAFRCLGVPPAAALELDALLQGFPRTGAAAGTPEIPEIPEIVDLRVEGSGTPEAPFAIVVAGPEGGRWQVPPGAPLSSHLEYRVVDGAIQRTRSHWVLHAGAVVAGDGTCLVIGESGAGKTSLALWLSAAGLPLVSDDLCPIPRGSRRPEVFPRALHMDAQYSPRLLARIPPRPAGYPADYYPFPGAAGAAASPPPPISRLLVLERGSSPQGEVEVEELLQAQAVHHLLAALIKGPAFHYATALETLLPIGAACRAYRLRSSTPEGAGERALAILAS